MIYIDDLFKPLMEKHLLAFLCHLLSEGATAEEVCREIHTLHVIRRIGKRLPRNIGGRNCTTRDMAEFWAVNNNLSHIERALKWMRLFPDDSRTNKLTWPEVKELLREADRRERRRSK